MAHPKVEVVDKDLGWKAFNERIKQIQDWNVKVGVLADSAKGGLHVPGGLLTEAEIAAVLEFGTMDEHIPPRPFLANTFERERDKLVEMGKELIEKVLDGKVTTEKALNVMGAYMADETKKTITAGVPPPNAPSTIKKKGSDKPLIDTGRLLGSITWSVNKGKGDE